MRDWVRDSLILPEEVTPHLGFAVPSPLGEGRYQLRPRCESKCRNSRGRESPALPKRVPSVFPQPPSLGTAPALLHAVRELKRGEPRGPGEVAVRRVVLLRVPE